jgi:hypothetical protein
LAKKYYYGVSSDLPVMWVNECRKSAGEITTGIDNNEVFWLQGSQE